MSVTPWQHQERERSHRFTPARAILWPPRTGKSFAMVDLAADLFQIFEISAVIVVAPNGAHRNWELIQIPRHCRVPHHAFSWRSSDRKNLAKFEHFIMQSDTRLDSLAWFCINKEALRLEENKKAVKRFLRSRPDILLVGDEAHHFARPGSKQTYRMRSLGLHAKYRRILTGTVAEETPLQIYSQFEILQKDALGFHRFDEFQARYVVYERLRGRNYDTVKEYKNLDELKHRVAQHASVVLREDMPDLPPVILDTRLVELHADTQRIWRAFKKQDVQTLIDYGFQEVPTGAALITKLQQIEGGFIITPRGLVRLEWEDVKFNVVLDEALGYTSIVFCEYTHEVNSVAARLEEHKLRVAIIDGHHVTTRAQTIAAFMAGKLDTLVCQSRAASEAYELSAADKILYYSQPNIARVREQGKERATAMYGKSKSVVDIYAPGGSDAYNLTLTQNKTTLADDLTRRGLRAVLESLEL